MAFQKGRVGLSKLEEGQEVSMVRAFMSPAPWHTFHAAHLKAGASFPRPLPRALPPWGAAHLGKSPALCTPLMFLGALLPRCALTLTVLCSGGAEQLNSCKYPVSGIEYLACPTTAAKGLQAGGKFSEGLCSPWRCWYNS